MSSKWHKGSGGPAGDECQNLVPVSANRCGFDAAHVAHALRGEGFDASEDGTGRGTPLVPIAFAENSRSSLRLCGGDGQVSAQLTTGGGKPGQGQPCIAFHNRQDPDVSGEVTHPLGAKDNGLGDAQPIAFSVKDHGADATEDCSPTLRASGHDESHANGGRTPAVAFDMRGREGGSVPEGPHDTANIRAADGGSSRSYVAARWGVRRLMPVECERLQGFPDGWTAIEWRGKAADQCPDGPRYKALGNSKAVNVVVWIGERIAAVEAAADDAAVRAG